MLVYWRVTNKMGMETYRTCWQHLFSYVFLHIHKGFEWFWYIYPHMPRMFPIMSHCWWVIKSTSFWLINLALSEHWYIPLNSMFFESMRSMNIFPVKLVHHCTVPIKSQVDFPLHNFHICSPSQRLSRLSTFPLEWTATSTANKTCRPETGGSGPVN